MLYAVPNLICKFLYHLAILLPHIIVTFDIAVAHTVQLPTVRNLPLLIFGDSTGWQLIFQVAATTIPVANIPDRTDI